MSQITIIQSDAISRTYRMTITEAEAFFPTTKAASAVISGEKKTTALQAHRLLRVISNATAKAENVYVKQGKNQFYRILVLEILRNTFPDMDEYKLWGIITKRWFDFIKSVKESEARERN